ncbi:MAG: hypothetical protein CFE34_09510 [Rhodobacteraceae bacterium PARR1]|nr:MAG: hypothetical protein CFE34_09510 [Rhodobacteraceae bacterium PARR1]
MSRRVAEVSLGVFWLAMMAVTFPWNDPLPPDSIDHIVLPMLGGGVAFVAAFIWFRWKRIPGGAQGGALCVSAEGIDYHVGPDHIRLSWTEVAAVYPVTRPSQTQTRAVWLPRADPARPNSSRMALLEIAHAKSPYLAVERSDGVLLPLTLFGMSKGKPAEIMDALRRHHAEASRP